MAQNLSFLPGCVLPWYQANKRELPWRQDREAYHIWLSEIMLQQTRVEAVRGYYTRFLAELPTIKALAECDDDRLRKLWEGLGYYSRVRNLKKAAGVILQEHGGVFPRDYAQVRRLPGIGDYTAGAICSIAYDFPTPAVDGNVLRVVSRLLDDPAPIDLPETKLRVRELLAQIYPREAGDFTQALMELGATVCGPNRAPDCDACPCREHCLAHLHGTAAGLPVKSPKKAKRQEALTVFICRCGDEYALQKRPGKGLLADLWQFPNVPGTLEPQQALDRAQELGLRPLQLKRVSDRKHIFTHVVWQMRGVFLETEKSDGPWQWFTEEAVAQSAALPTAFRQFWEERENV